MLSEKSATTESLTTSVKWSSPRRFPEAELLQVLSNYPRMSDAVWCQEEPMNQGAWYSSQHHMRRVIARHKQGVYLHYVGRDASAAPAAGYMALHLAQQEAFINQALTFETTAL